MEWLINNWTLLVAIIAVVVVVIVAVIAFFKLPVAAQKQKIKEWLLYAVIEAEKELGSGTGIVKLHKCYDAFIEKFSFLSVFISFETFSHWVDEALDKMRELLSTNENVANFVSDKTDKS